MELNWGKKLKKRIFTPTGRRKKQAELGEKLKNRIFAPTGRRKKQAGLGGKAKIEGNPPT